MNYNEVAPHAGAWIETMPLSSNSLPGRVAPHAGAWIETLRPGALNRRMASHPMRVRGLKQQITILIFRT